MRIQLRKNKGKILLGIIAAAIFAILACTFYAASTSASYTTAIYSEFTAGTISQSSTTEQAYANGDSHAWESLTAALSLIVIALLPTLYSLLTSFRETAKQFTKYLHDQPEKALINIVLIFTAAISFWAALRSLGLTVVRLLQSNFYTSVTIINLSSILGFALFAFLSLSLIHIVDKGIKGLHPRKTLQELPIQQTNNIQNDSNEPIIPDMLQISIIALVIGLLQVLPSIANLMITGGPVPLVSVAILVILTASILCLSFMHQKYLK